MKKQQNKHGYFTCPLCLVEQPIDELSEDGDSCKACYEEGIIEAESTMLEQYRYRYE